MARIFLTLMNSINSDLEFTVETPEDFEQEKLPTLDFKIWQETDGTINHSYFQKPIKTPFVVMSRSGMSNQQKIQILAKELTRRISNINILRSSKDDYIEVIEQFTQELRNSEYPHHTARQIVLSGIRGLSTKIIRRKAKNQEFYRAAHTTAHSRAKKKLVNRESWYKRQEQENQNTEISCSPPENNFDKNTRTLNAKKSPENKKQGPEPKIKAVMFVPHTPGSELAKKLRENEEHLVKITGTKVKIIERTGTKIQDLLTRSNPWKGADCERQNCLLCFTKCKTEKNKSQDCHQRNVVYEIRCLTCQELETNKIIEQDLTQQEKVEQQTKIKLFKYIGETSRSCYERGWEHLNDLTSLKSSSHMLKHIVNSHPEQDPKEVHFGMKIIRTCKTSFERQVYESVAIQQEREQHHILNYITY